VRTNVESGAGAVAGAGAAAGVAAGGAGVCAPAIKAIAMTAAAMVCSMRFGFKYIGTVPPRKKMVVNDEE
jgi:hypothetical protein